MLKIFLVQSDFLSSSCIIPSSGLECFIKLRLEWLIAIFPLCYTSLYLFSDSLGTIFMDCSSWKRSLHAYGILRVETCLEDLQYWHLEHKINHLLFEQCQEQTNIFYMRKTKTQISFAVTVKLISAFVFTT